PRSAAAAATAASAAAGAGAGSGTAAGLRYADEAVAPGFDLDEVEQCILQQRLRGFADQQRDAFDVQRQVALARVVEAHAQGERAVGLGARGDAKRLPAGGAARDGIAQRGGGGGAERKHGCDPPFGASVLALG